jgi:hypothetical protein
MPDQHPQRPINREMQPTHSVGKTVKVYEKQHSWLVKSLLNCVAVREAKSVAYARHFIALAASQSVLLRVCGSWPTVVQVRVFAFAPG